MVSAHLSPSSIFLPVKSQKCPLEARMRVKLDSKEVNPKWLKGGSLVQAREGT